MSETAVISNGLDGIVVAETQISEVDGQRGKLIIRGRDAEELAFNSTLEQTCALLWSVPGVSAKHGSVLQNQFFKARAEAFELLQANPVLLKQSNPMDALRTAVSFLGGRAESGSDAEAFVSVTASIGVVAANWSRLQRGLSLAAPDPNLSVAGDFLRLLRDKPASEAEVQALDTYLTTVSDHGMNASTFVARVVASTASDNVSCVVAAIGALKGPLHGGAPGPVFEMLDQIGSPENAEAWLNKELDAGKRIMGMGHRIYRVRDPRAAIFEQAIKRLESAGITASRLALARAVEKKAEELLTKRHPDRPLNANVEFYTAVLLDVLQVPHDLFTTVFATGRVAGWCAHIAEQRAQGRLIRPASKYIGPYPSTMN